MIRRPPRATLDRSSAASDWYKRQKVDTLPGGENLGQIDDLRYFNNKLLRGLRVPSSYLPTGPEDGSAVYNDGKGGVASVSYTHLRAHETKAKLVCRLMLEKKKNTT